MNNELTLFPRAQLARMPEVVKSLEKDERLILGASLHKPVGEYSLEALSAQLNGVIDWIARDVGYRIQGDDDRQYIIVRTGQLLKRYYDNLSVEDFRLAFEMAVAGELDTFLPRDWRGNADARHYQQFSAEYICKILNAYKVKRGMALRKAEAVGPKKENGVPEADQRENARRIRSELAWCWLHYKHRGWFPALSPIQEMRFYDILAGVGLADDIEVTEAERKAVLTKALMHYAGQGMVGDMTRLKKEGTDADELKGEAARLARKTTLFRALKEIVDNDIILTDYIQI